MTGLRIAFLGNHAWSVPTLEALAEADDVEIVRVITNPPRPAGRGSSLRPTPVADAADRLGLPLLEAEGVAIGRRRAGDRGPRARCPRRGRLRSSSSRQPSWTCHELGSLNLHFSLLPRWRGAAPVQRAILEGDTTTGVSVMLLDEGLDTGPIVMQREVPIAATDDTGSLGERLAGLGAPLVVEALRSLRGGTAEVVAQDAAAALVAPKILPEERDLDWTVDAQAAVRRIRALAPAPGAITTFREAPLKVLQAEATGPWGAVFTSIRGPGQLHMAQDGTPVVDTRGGTAVRLLEVVPMGKARMAGSDWARGARFEPGERLG